MSIKYQDKHLNIYAAYGPHRLWENNLTSALGKLLHYSSQAFRKSFAREFLKVPGGRRSDFSIALQRRDARISKCGEKYALLLRPHKYIDYTEFSDRITRKRKDPRPDLWLVREDGSQAVLIEVKLWSGEGRSQASDYAKQFKARLLKEVTFEDLHQWLSKQNNIGNDSDFLRRSLIAYLEDFGVTSSDRFSTRYFSVGADGKFDEPILLKRHLLSLSSLLAENLKKSVCAEPHVGNLSPDGERMYVDFGLKNKESVAYPALGFHSDGFCPCIFISGLRSKWMGKYAGRRGMDAFIRLAEKAQKNNHVTGFEKAINKLPEGATLMLKAYRQRVRYIDPDSHEAKATFVKLANGNWENTRDGRNYPHRIFLDHIIRRISKLHGKKVLRSSYWQYSSIGINWKCVPYDVIESHGALNWLEVELAQLVKYASLISKY